MSFINRLKGEEPGFFTRAAHALQGTGHYGEYLADYALDHGKIPGRGRSFTNLYVPYRGRTSEVDVLFLHETGAYVIESKNYSGWIFGSAEQRQWTQCLSGGRLVKRSEKYGEFTGCSNYPKCRYTAKG